MPSWAFPPGGQLCGLFSSDKRYGYKAYDVPKPGALLMGYPVNDFAEIKPVYHAVMDPGILQMEVLLVGYLRRHHTGLPTDLFLVRQE